MHTQVNHLTRTLPEAGVMNFDQEVIITWLIIEIGNGVLEGWFDVAGFSGCLTSLTWKQMEGGEKKNRN